MAVIEYKRCTRCRKRKPVSEFYRRGDSDRPRSHCIACIELHTDKEARIRRAALWRVLNPQASSANAKAWRLKHPEYDRLRWARDSDRIGARGRDAYQRHRKRRIADQLRRDCLRGAEIAAYRKRWWRANADKAAVYRNGRRAAKRNAGGRYTVTDVRELFARQRGRCFYCSCELLKYHVDHKTPLSRGGSNDRRNLALACASCNLRKRTRTAREFKALLAV